MLPLNINGSRFVTVSLMVLGFPCDGSKNDIERHARKLHWIHKDAAR
jgi:hypothetical protein